jgi:mRNA interferase RelE/StbE
MRVAISPGADRDIDRLSADVAERVLAAIQGLGRNPRPAGCLRLRGYDPPTWRLRVGPWRIDRAALVRVTGVRHRSKAY